MNKKKAKKVLFVLPSLEGGGAERVTVYIVNRLDRERFQPALAVLRREGPYLDEVRRSIPIYDLGHSTRCDYVRTVVNLARILKEQRFDIVVSSMWHACMIALVARAVSGSTASLILKEEAHLSMVLRNKRFRRLKKYTIKAFYPKARAIYVVSEGIKRDMIRNFGIPPKKLRVIYNPIDTEGVRSMSQQDVDDPWHNSDRPLIVAAGRLTEQKGFPHLVRAFARVRREMPCTLAILGEGPQRGELERLGRELALGQDFILPGFQRNPYKFMGRATAFVLSSLWEGFGNVIIEAMACGTPVVATRCPSGPEEIIEHGRTGLLVPPGDEDSLVQAMLTLLRNETLRRELSIGGKRRAEDFRIDKIVRQYEDLFLETIAGR